MKTRPITFGAPMVRAILEGRKSQTRRVVKVHPSNPVRGPVSTEYQHVNVGRHSYDNDKPPAFGARFSSPSGAELFVPCPYGVPGERLWVREMLRRRGAVWCYAADESLVLVREEDRTASIVWAHHKERDYAPSIHMPRWASRITLEVVSVRVERVQDISEYDAIAEGVSGWVADPRCETARDGFRVLWESINGSRGHGWDANPWVWRIEFRVVTT